MTGLLKHCRQVSIGATPLLLKQMLDINSNALPSQTSERQELKVAGQLTQKLDWSGHAEIELMRETLGVIVTVPLLP